LAPDTIINRIRKEVQSISFSDVEMVDLLVWLRNYNSSKKEKVRFMGMCWPGMHRYWTPVADYLLTYYRPEYADEFLTVLNHLWFWGELNPSKALQVFQEKTCFKKLIPPIDYELFRDVLIQCEEIVNSLKKEPYLKLRLLQFHQDYIMFRNVKKGIDLYLKEEEKAVLISHYGHVGRLSGLTKETSSMGYFLDKTYGDAYFPVGIFVGEGYANVQDAQRKDMFFFRLVPPPVNSLEKMCKETHTTNFYAPASVLPDEALFTRKVGFSGINPQFQYDRPKIHCDGFIFIHSTPRGGFIDRSKIRIDLEINTMYDQRRKKMIIEKNLNGFY
jgi:erythromycin esterase-like protein